MRLTGLRGVGKTVLLAEFERVAQEDDWATGSLELQPGHNTEDELVRAVARIADSTREALSKMERLRTAVGTAVKRAGSFGVTWEGVTFSYQPGFENGSPDLARSLFDVTKAAAEKARQGFVLLLDESQAIRDERDRHGEHPLSLLISSVVALQRSEVPIGLVVCGLPTLTGNLLRARSYTERMFRGEEIGSLDGDDALQAFTRPLAEAGGGVDADPQLALAVVEEVEGYPYFIQLWGAELWDAAEIAEVDRLSLGLLEAARTDIYRRLDVDFYEPRVSTLTPAEQDVLLATASCEYPPLSVSDLNSAVDKSPGNINVLLGRLVENGVLYRVRKGQYEYTAPKFRDYLQRRTGQPA
jgi:DNA-binding transcriptional ArsR family regulator